MYKIYFLKKEQCCNFFDFWGNVRNKLMLCKKKSSYSSYLGKFCVFVLHPCENDNNENTVFPGFGHLKF